jgi:very-short-patch-repair endonuclease
VLGCGAPGSWGGGWNVRGWRHREDVGQNHSSDEGALEQLLRAQHRVIARRQALACGMTDRMLQFRIRPGGPWRKLLPGVYVTVTGTVSREQREMAALLYAGSRSVLTGLAAARRHGISTLTSTTVDVLVPAKVRFQSTAFVRVRRTWRMPEQVCIAGEIRYVMPGRAVADAARSMTVARDVRGLVAQTVQQQRCSIEMLNIELEQGPAQGSALLRAALVEVRDGIRSVAEGDLRTLLRRGRVPMPQFNARLYDRGRLIAMVDAWWADEGVVAEVDSREYHYSAEDWQQTMRRHDRLVAQGVLLLHFTPGQIRSAPEEVITQIRAALAAGRRRARLPIVTRPAA